MQRLKDFKSCTSFSEMIRFKYENPLTGIKTTEAWRNKKNDQKATVVLRDKSSGQLKKLYVTDVELAIRINGNKTHYVFKAIITDEWSYEEYMVSCWTSAECTIDISNSACFNRPANISKFQSISDASETQRLFSTVECQFLSKVSALKCVVNKAKYYA
mgnify:CR=1 FL=1